MRNHKNEINSSEESNAFKECIFVQNREQIQQKMRFKCQQKCQRVNYTKLLSKIFHLKYTNFEQHIYSHALYKSSILEKKRFCFEFRITFKYNCSFKDALNLNIRIIRCRQKISTKTTLENG